MASTGSSYNSPEPEVAVPADIVIGVASYHNADTIAPVVREVCAGLSRHLAGRPSCIVIADVGSSDQTLVAAREAAEATCTLIPVEVERAAEGLVRPFHGFPGRAGAIRSVLRTAQERQASACAVVDAALLTLSSAWVPMLVEPALGGGFDYVSGHYRRHPHEGAITKSIVYPVFRALYGARLRQPAAAEFGCSSRLAQHFLDQPFWERETAHAAIDLWLATSAAVDGFRVCEADLGIRGQAPRPDQQDLSTTLAQVVGALFSDMEVHADAWQRVRGSTPVPITGELPADEPAVPQIDVQRLGESYRLGYRALRDVWAWILPPKVILQLKRLADSPMERFRMEDDLWARIVYDFALGHRLHTMPRDHLLGSLTPLYLGWLASFILEVTDMDRSGADARLERLGAAFESEKPYLISRWRWPDRFRS